MRHVHRVMPLLPSRCSRFIQSRVTFDGEGEIVFNKTIMKM